MNTCMHCCISGLVQGVFFRASTRDEARRLGLAGWVRNLPDGRVEVFACGEKEQLDSLLAWLHEGPPHANVSGVEVDWHEQERGHGQADDFEVC